MSGEANPERTSRTAARRERETGYGWTSIVLHWVTAIAIFVLLFAGDSISQAGAQARQIHTTVATCVWLVFAFRIVWRLWQGHPPPASGKITWTFQIATLLHYVMLGAIGLMLVSGPLAGWATGLGLDVFDLHVPGASPVQPEIAGLARSAHIVGATTLAVSVLLHMAGAMKHMFVDRDGSFDRIMAPAPKPPK